jgi:hypothetical protein
MSEKCKMPVAEVARELLFGFRERQRESEKRLKNLLTECWKYAILHLADVKARNA